MADGSIKEYLDTNHWRKSENANTNESFSNMTNYVMGKILALDFLDSIPEELRKAHLNAIIHIHNLESGGYIPYCCGCSLKLLLANGMRTPSINSRPAKHFNSIVDQAMNWLYCSQMEMAGAQSFGNFDSLLAPFVRKDQLKYSEVKQQIQKLIYNLNFSMRSSSQTPFSNLTLNYCVPKFLDDEEAIIGGELSGIKYSDCADEVLMIDKAMNEVMSERDPYGLPFTFPILTVELNGKFPWNDPTIDFLWDNCSDIGSYYFMNYIGSGISEDTVRSLCCRLNLDISELGGPHGIWNTSDGTGSLGVVTVNMSRLAYDCKGKDQNYLFEELDRRLQMTLDILRIRKARVLKYQNRMMPFNTMNGWSMKNYFMTIGIIGLNEMNLNYLGVPIQNDYSLVAELLMHVREWIRNTKKETRELINMEMIPGEGCETSDTMVYTENGLMRMDEYISGIKVYNGNGKLEEPKVYSQREYSGDVYKIYPYYNIPLTLTPEHLVLAKRNIHKNKTQSSKYNCIDSKLEWTKARDLQENDVVAFPVLQEINNIIEINIMDYIGNLKEVVVENNHIRYLRHPKHPIPIKIPINKDLMYLFGLYIAEGSSTKSTIVFSLNSNEINLSQSIKDIMLKYFNLKAKVRIMERHRMQVIFHSTILGTFLKTIFGSGAKNKRLPSYFLYLDKEMQQSLLSGMLDGDGSIDKWGQTYSTSSNTLASQFMLLLPRLGCIPSFQYNKKKDAYKISIYGKSIVSINKQALTHKKYHWNHGWIRDNYLYMPIRKIEKLGYSGFVYNFETPSNTYLNGCIVHNSSYRLAKIDKSKCPGIVTLGAEDPYYSTLLIPPLYDVDVLDRIEIEEKILPLFSGGTIFRTFIGDKKPSIGSTREFIHMMARSKIPYFDITSTYSLCLPNGHMERGSHTNCSKCGSEMEVYSRVVGYYRKVSRWNPGKVAEFKDRRYTTL